ncbi:unnamed protein product [Scytosiphon promiscuus]
MVVTVAVVPGTEAGPIFFQINHERSGRSWAVKQRFSALDAMRHALWKNRLPLPDVPFPRKQAPILRLVNKWQPHSRQAMPAHELEDRRNGLQVYLTALSGLKDSWQSDLVTEVLCVAEEDATVPASSPASNDQSNSNAPSSVAPHCATKAVSWVDQQTPATALTQVATKAAASRVQHAAASSSPPVSALSSKSVPPAQQAASDERDSSTGAGDPASASESSPARSADVETTDADGIKEALEAVPAAAAEFANESVPQQQQKQKPLSMEAAPAGPVVVADELSPRVPASMVFGDVSGAEHGTVHIPASAPMLTALVDSQADIGPIALSSPKKKEAGITSPIAPVAGFAASSPDPSSRQTPSALPTLARESEQRIRLPDLPPEEAEGEEEALSGGAGGGDRLPPDAVSSAGVTSDANAAVPQDDSTVPAPTSAAVAVDEAEVSMDLPPLPTREASEGAPTEVAGQEQPSQTETTAVTVGEVEVSEELSSQPAPTSVDAPDEVAGEQEPSETTSAAAAVDRAEVTEELASQLAPETLVDAPDVVAEEEQPSQAEVSEEVSSHPTPETSVDAPDEVAGEQEPSETTSAAAAVDRVEVSEDLSSQPTPETLVDAPDMVTEKEQPSQAEAAAATIGEAEVTGELSLLPTPNDDVVGEPELIRAASADVVTDEAKACGELAPPPVLDTLACAPDEEAGQEQPSQAEVAAPANVPAVLDAAAAPAAADVTLDPVGMTVRPEGKEITGCDDNSRSDDKEEGDEGVRGREGASAVSQLGLSSATEEGEEDNAGENPGARGEEPQQQEAGRCMAESTSLQVKDETGKDVLPSLLLSAPGTAAKAAVVLAAEVAAETEPERNIWQAESPPMADARGNREEQAEGATSPVAAPVASQGSPLPVAEGNRGEDERPAPTIATEPCGVPVEGAVEPVAAAGVAAAAADAAVPEEEGGGGVHERGRGEASAVSTLTLSPASEDAKEKAAPQEATVPPAASAASAAAAAAAAVAMEEEENHAEAGGHFERGRGGASAVSTLTLSSASEDAKDDAAPEEASVPSVGSAAAAAAAAAAAVASAAVTEEEERQGSVERFERDRGEASAVSALGLSSASEDPKEALPLQANAVSADNAASAISRQHAGEAGPGERTTATPASATKGRTSLLKRARRSLSSKKSSPDRKQKAAVATTAAGRTSPPGEILASGAAVLASPPATGAASLTLRSVSPTPTADSASSPAIVTPRTISKLASFRDKARSLKDRLSVGGGGGGGPKSARTSGSGPIPARESPGGGGGGRSGSGPLSLSSARGVGKVFFFSTSTKSPPPSDAPPPSGGRGEGGTAADAPMLSPDSLKSGDGGDGLAGEPLESAGAAGAVSSAGEDKPPAIGNVAILAVPPSPGTE